MKIIVCFLFLSVTLSSLSQENTPCSYLLVRIENPFDNTMNRSYCSINAEPGCGAANFLYTLKSYNAKKNAVNADRSFYYNHADTSNNIYNYFVSATEAINYIASKGWYLFAVYTDTYSGYTTEDNGHNGEPFPITTVSSKPVFCFKKPQ